MHNLARDGRRRGWWQTYRHVISPEYADLISLEADAKNMRTFQTSLIPGLLQTSAYARATKCEEHAGRCVLGTSPGLRASAQIQCAYTEWSDVT
nr:DUF5753 domain-containing protein [Streptomyces sp. NBC_00857]